MSSGTRIRIPELPREGDVWEVFHAWREIFPQPGEYFVEPLAKAVSGHENHGFDEWFLQRLYEVSLERSLGMQEAIWTVLDELLMERGVRTPSDLEWLELQNLLFDLQGASTARMAGLKVPKALLERLGGFGWTPFEQLDFPALAYRMGRIYERLEKTEPMPWEELIKLAQDIPLGSAERVAVDHLRRHAGNYLRPVYTKTGEAWVAEREQYPLRELLSAGAERRKTVRRLARELGNSQRARGIARDAERVVRTEMAEARSRGAWENDRKRWKDEALIFRQTSSTPCKVCLRMFKNPDGTPKLYRPEDVEKWSELGPNTGPKENWVPKIGPIHPNCVCPPWEKYLAVMKETHEKHAPYYANLMQAMGIQQQAA